MQRNGEVLKGVITVIVWLLAVAAISFAAYVYISPKPVQIVQKQYMPIDTSYYNVDENELNGQWLSTQDFTIDKNDLDMYEALKEYYKGRDNPFGNMNDYREQIIIEQQPIIQEEEETIIE